MEVAELKMQRFLSGLSRMDKIGNEYPHPYPPTSLSLVLLPFYWAYSSLFFFLYLNRSYFSVTHSQTEIKSVVSGLKKNFKLQASVKDPWFDEDTRLSWCLFGILLIEEGLRWIIRLKLSTVQPYYNLFGFLITSVYLFRTSPVSASRSSQNPK